MHSLIFSATLRILFLAARQKFLFQLTISLLFFQCIQIYLNLNLTFILCAFVYVLISHFIGCYRVLNSPWILTRSAHSCRCIEFNEISTSNGTGRGLGSFLGGILISTYGSRITFRILGSVAGTSGLLFIGLYFLTPMRKIDQRRLKQGALALIAYGWIGFPQWT